jgi:hypothetical protein
MPQNKKGFIKMNELEFKAYKKGLKDGHKIAIQLLNCSLDVLQKQKDFLINTACATYKEADGTYNEDTYYETVMESGSLD